MTSLHCPKCTASLPQMARFCAQCGWDLSKPLYRRAFRLRDYILVGIFGIALWCFGWNTQKVLAGKRPVTPFEKTAAKEEVAYNDPTLDRLRAATKTSPNDVGAWRALSTALIEKLSGIENPPSALIFEELEVLSQIIKITPDDADAVLAIADISFNQQVFDKAISYYEKYLKLAPNDVEVTSRYATALSFTGKGDEAIKVLKATLAKNPKSFQATASLALTYAHNGDTKQALSVGEQALTLAPSDDVRARFSQFVDEMKKGEGSSPPQAQPAQAAAQGQPNGSESERIAAIVESNPVAGPKFVRAEAKDSATVLLYFKDFPMAQMPPFMKDKFLSGLKEKAKSAGIKSARTLVFIDEATGAEMTRTELAG